MEEHGRFVGRFVAVVFVEERVAGIRRIDERVQLVAQGLDLRAAEDTDTWQVAVLTVERDPILGEAVLLHFGRSTGSLKQAADEIVI